MTTESKSFVGFLDELEAGDHDAAAGEIFNRYTHRLIGLARSRLSKQLRHKVDPEDVVQSVYRSFFRKHSKGMFDFDSWEGVWALLTLLTLRKCYARVDYHFAGKRDVRLEATPNAADGDSVRRIEFQSTDPTPDEAAALTELVERVMSELDERQQEIISLTLQGYEVSEISKQVALSERTVSRVRNTVRTRLREMLEGDQA